MNEVPVSDKHISWHLFGASAFLVEWKLEQVEGHRKGLQGFSRSRENLEMREEHAFVVSECKCEINVLLQSLLGLVGIECITHSLERSEDYKIVIYRARNVIEIL